MTKDTAEKIQRLVRESTTSLSAGEIADRLGVARSDVNRVLCANLHLFQPRAGANGVRWQAIRAGALDVESVIGQAGGDAEGGITLHDWQVRALNAWRGQGNRGIIAAVTGAGKTRLGVAAIDRHMAANRRFAKAAVLVPTNELMRQWRVELEQTLDLRVGVLGGGETSGLFDCDVLVSVINSARAQLPDQVRQSHSTRPVLLVADECHRYGADSFSQALDAPYDASLGLTATPQRDYDLGMEIHVLPKVGQVVFEYSHADALADGVIVDFNVAFVGVDFTGPEHAAYAELTDRIATARHNLLAAHPELELTSRLFFGHIQRLARDDDATALAFLGAVANRRQLLVGAESRATFIEWLIGNAAWPGKAILFHERIEQCEALADLLADAGIPAAAHHSQLGAITRRRVLDAFASGSLRAIVAPKTLDEGIDVPDADLAIIVAGSSVKRQRIQRMGRVLRIASGKEVAAVLVVYVRGSREDPNQSDTTDGFAEAMENIDRAHWFVWPSDGDKLVSHLRGDLVDSQRRPRLEPPAPAIPRRTTELTDPVELPPTQRQLLELTRRGYRGENPLSQADANRLLAKLPERRTRRAAPDPPAHRDPSTPTFVQLLQVLPATRRLTSDRRSIAITRIREDLKVRTRIELNRVRMLPPEQQARALHQLKARRDRLEAELAALDS